MTIRPMQQIPLAYVLVLSLSFAVGCGRQTTPVVEVAIEESQVSVKEMPALMAEWAVWRGPLGNGMADNSEIPTEWSESKNVKWMADVPGRGHGSPCVVKGRVLLASANDSSEKQFVLAYDAETGDELWNKTIHEGGFPRSGQVHQKGSNANSTVASDGERAYIAFLNQGKIFATALTLDGEIAWQKELGSFNSKFGFAPSPVFYKSLVIFACDNQGGGYLTALDGESGELAWRKKRPAKNSHSSPLIAEVGGKDQLLLSGCGTVDSYNPETGEQFWSTKGTSDTTCGTMVANETHVFAAGGFPAKQVICLDSEGKEVWQKRIKVYEPSMLLVDDTLFAISDQGVAYAWSTEDGKERWKERLGGNFSASPILSGGNIFVSNLAGKTFVFEANPNDYVEVSENSLGADCYASPAVVGGRLYLRPGFRAGGGRREKLVCIASE